MDKASIEAFLALGMSLEQIGSRLGREASTVGYWVRKHGLQAVNRDRHAARGGLARERLAPLVDEGLSIAKIARRLGVSAGTVQYWLERHSLRTSAGRGRLEALAAKREGRATVTMQCRHHGVTDFWLEGRGSYRCLRCRWEAVARRRRKVKAILVEEAGGACFLCGYDRYIGALQFHHTDPEGKAFGVSGGGLTRSLDHARGEARKCTLLCANCHAEVEGGMASLPVADGPAPAVTA